MEPLPDKQNFYASVILSDSEGVPIDGSPGWRRPPRRLAKRKKSNVSKSFNDDQDMKYSEGAFVLSLSFECQHVLLLRTQIAKCSALLSSQLPSIFQL